MTAHETDLAKFFEEVFDDQFMMTFGRPDDKSTNGSLMFTVQEGDELVAAATCKRLYQTIKISDLAVKTSRQKTGLGSQLIRNIKDYAKEEGILWLILTTRSYQAKGFYLKHGFEVYGQLTDMPFTGVTTYYMACRLD